MASSDRLREIQKSRVSSASARSTHHSQFKKPPHFRAMLWVAGSVVLAGSLLGVLKTSSHSETIAISQDDINSQIMSRGAIGSGTVKIRDASVYLGGGLFQVDAMARDDVYQTALTMTGGLKFDPLKNTIFPEDPDTTVSKAVKIGDEIGDGAAGYVPQDWTLVQAVVRTTANFATGETFSAMQFENKAKRALWGLPVYELPSNIRSVVRGSTIQGISVAGNSVILDISKRQLTMFGVLCLIAAVGSAALLLMLRSYPDLARE